ncbi:hypothetical protein [Reyranella sp.]|uniref:hypothetical protein n=1 Tax=Reyranella sp. TaxID=1929291 RepID=UPI003BAAC0CE
MTVLRLMGVVVVASAMAACGGGSEEKGPPVDQTLEQASRAGAQAMSMGLSALAVREYKAALARAYERDDAGAIADSGFNLALALMRANDPRAAMATINEVRAELDRRGVATPAALFLAEAAAAYRNGAPDAALAALRPVLDDAGGDPDTLARAWFIRGLIAADRGDGATLSRAIGALTTRKPSAEGASDFAADLAELQGRSALLQGRDVDALALFERAAADRQLALDYRGMARALAWAGDAAGRAGQTARAAGLYLRAGRSALLQGDPATARPLLERADSLARQTGQGDVVDEVQRLRKAAPANTRS